MNWKAAITGGALCALAVCLHPLSVRAAELLEPSRYLAEAKETRYSTLPWAGGRVLLGWNFSAAGEFPFSYRQQTQSVLETSSFPPERKKVIHRSSRSEGVVLVKGRDGFADLILNNQRSHKVVTSEGEAPKTFEQHFPPMVLQKMGEDGAIPLWRERDLTWGLLFRMPTRPLARGETAEVPVRLPFETSGSQLELGGVVRLTFTDVVEVEGRPCARIDAEIDISRLDLPVEVPGMYSYFAKGASVLFYDLGERRVVAARIALRHKKFAETPISFVTIDGVPRPDRPEWSRVAEDFDTYTDLMVSRNRPSS